MPVHPVFPFPLQVSQSYFISLPYTSYYTVSAPLFRLDR